MRIFFAEIYYIEKNIIFKSLNIIHLKYLN